MIRKVLCFVHTILEFLQVFSPISILNPELLTQLNSLLNTEAEHLLCAECLELFTELWCKSVVGLQRYTHHTI